MSTETQVITPLAAEILDHHEEVQKSAEEARQKVERTLDKARACGALVDAARAQWGSRFAERWRVEVGLPEEDRRRYLTLFKARERPLNKDQLLLSGILPPQECSGHEARADDEGAWRKSLGKSGDILEKWFTSERIESMDPINKGAARMRLSKFISQLETLIKRLA